MLLLAKDGVFLPTAPRNITQGLLASGNRADVLINCPVGEFTFESPRTENETKLCSLPVRPVEGAIKNKKYRDTCKVHGTLLHIRSVDRGLPPKCDLPEFEVNRPCCDCGRHSNLEDLGSNGPKNTSAHPEFASCAGRPRQLARPGAGGGKECEVCHGWQSGSIILWRPRDGVWYWERHEGQHTLLRCQPRAVHLARGQGSGHRPHLRGISPVSHPHQPVSSNPNPNPNPKPKPKPKPKPNPGPDQVPAKNGLPQR
eukprot:scaffold18176_cov60-Phaeocystis_antarctica.AAC.1